ncbi:MAG: 2,3,4,5-tetrahydropyridine-2,6-dicarboxylate N-succinyltransferase [Acidobacteria bacterium]|nr:2,3,4,5-tetrahydropyridine-2,6-dicarboxylate N-succinyltransferase [Acidobacteriota bacterium]
MAAAGAEPEPRELRAALEALFDALEAGEVRAAYPEGDRWEVATWVKAALLLAFRHGHVEPLAAAPPWVFRDKEFFPPRAASSLERVRVVFGGSSVRRGAHVGAGAILMPPCFVNTGAYVGAGSMIDSHALVGSCAQVGHGVHLSAGAQVGGVLEPPGAMPVVIEDDVFVGALSAVVEGVRVRRGAVLGAGVILTASSRVYDVPRRRVLRAAGPARVLEIPERAVVVAGARPLADEWARGQGLAAAAAIIIKDRDASTDARAVLEEGLRR